MNILYLYFKLFFIFIFFKNIVYANNNTITIGSIIHPNISFKATSTTIKETQIIRLKTENLKNLESNTNVTTYVNNKTNITILTTTASSFLFLNSTLLQNSFSINLKANTSTTVNSFFSYI